MQKIDHPNIIKVYHIEGASYIMEKADCNLEEYILNNNITDEEKEKIIDGIVEGVKILHSEPLSTVHRDLNPRNILMINGIPKIADLGICKPLNNQTVCTLKEEREALGTFGYMCTEQLNGGEPKLYFDIFSLGRIIYFIESRKNPPFVGRLDPEGYRLSEYKQLILATQQEQPIVVPDIATFIEKRNAILTKFLSKSEAIQHYAAGLIEIPKLIEAFQNGGVTDVFEMFNKCMLKIHANIQFGEDDKVEAVARLYLEQCSIYTQRKYWNFKITDDIVANILHLFIKTADDLYKQKLLVDAFKYSYEYNQWSSMDIFDEYVKKGEISSRECIQIMQIHNIKEDLITKFINRCNQLK